MSLKENLRAKIKLDGLLRKLVSTIREPPGRRWVDKVLTQELLDITDFEYRKFRDLHLYSRPLEGEIMEVLVFDNEKTLSLGLKKGPFSPKHDLALAWVMQYVRGEEPADLKDMDVFIFLVELALDAL